MTIPGQPVVNLCEVEIHSNIQSLSLETAQSFHTATASTIIALANEYALHLKLGDTMGEPNVNTV